MRLSDNVTYERGNFQENKFSLSQSTSRPLKGIFLPKLMHKLWGRN